MSTSSITEGSKHSALRKPVDPHELTMDEIVPYLVGHTVDEVERELIIHTLIHHCGSRTRSAHILGISIRCIRDKIHEYEDLGIAVPVPGEPRVSIRH
jgi:DNA-binding NtrC family response regulator